MIEGFEAEEDSEKDRAARTVNRRDGKYDGPVPNVSQAPQAVRSAGGRRRIGAFLVRTRADRTLYSDKRDAFGLAIPVHRLRNISSTVATRAEIQSAFSPSGLQALCTTKMQNSPTIFLRYESRTNVSAPVSHTEPIRKTRSLSNCSNGLPKKGSQDAHSGRLLSRFLDASSSELPNAFSNVILKTGSPSQVVSAICRQPTTDSDIAATATHPP